MVEKVHIQQDIITFKEIDREKWYKELDKKSPFDNDYTIIPSVVPLYNRQKTIEKAIKRPERYFRECCVIKAYSSKFERAYYTHSIQLFFAKKWRNRFPPEDPFQEELYDDLHNVKYINPEHLKTAQERKFKSDYLIHNNINPKMPDVWFVKNYPQSLFVEVKRLGESFVEGQKEGLSIIRKYLRCDIRIARVCSENEGYKKLIFENIDITGIYHEI
jgi:hypothetical protein